MPSKKMGLGLLQSEAEWAQRNSVLGRTLGELAQAHLSKRTGRGLDIGCQTGELTDIWSAQLPLTWYGIDPKIAIDTMSPGGHRLVHGWADQLPFPDAHFDCAIMANVYEHIPPEKYDASLREIHRVLAPGGVLVGQLPNPYFPIESHSRLPFMGWLPYGVQKSYWKLSPVSWQHDFYVVTIRDLRKRAKRLGFEEVVVRNFNYPPEAIPRRFRFVARVLAGPMRAFPWAWQFVFSRRDASSASLV